MNKEIIEVDAAWILLPPKEVFIDSDSVFADFQAQQRFRLPDRWSIEYGKDGGLFFNDGKNPYAYPGVICPIILKHVAVLKRLIMSRIRSLKNPFVLLWFKQFKNELQDLICVELYKYFYKPQFYCRAVRELYRVLDLMGFDKLELGLNKNITIHAICLFFEQDSHYRFQMQAFFGNLNREKLKQNPRKEIMENIKYCIQEDEPRMKQHWKSLGTAFNVLWFASGKFRKGVKQFFQEIDLDEIQPDEVDTFFQTH